mmetsp:Transcript_11637/g.33879  ORF Transcript_11637/g.33879 Transcript_11637/m.33879 type:complete len:243 (-) Transcript_11637:89-817(-)
MLLLPLPSVAPRVLVAQLCVGGGVGVGWQGLIALVPGVLQGVAVALRQAVPATRLKIGIELRGLVLRHALVQVRLALLTRVAVALLDDLAASLAEVALESHLIHTRAAVGVSLLRLTKALLVVSHSALGVLLCVNLPVLPRALLHHHDLAAVEAPSTSLVSHHALDAVSHAPHHAAEPRHQAVEGREPAHHSHHAAALSSREEGVERHHVAVHLVHRGGHRVQRRTAQRTEGCDFAKMVTSA